MSKSFNVASPLNAFDHPMDEMNYETTLGAFNTEVLVDLFQHQDPRTGKENGILRSPDRCPTKDNLKQLARELNKMQFYVKLKTKHWPDTSERIRNLQGALQTIHETIPLLQVEIARSRQNASLDGEIGLAGEFSSALAILTKLADLSIRAKANRHLNHPELGLPESTRWQDMARHLQQLFLAATEPSNPGRALKAASYRFVVAVVPGITADVITFDQVESLLKKNRDVKWGNS